MKHHHLQGMLASTTSLQQRVMCTMCSQLEAGQGRAAMQTVALETLCTGALVLPDICTSGQEKMQFPCNMLIMDFTI